MPPHTPQWTDFLLCAVCCKTFNNNLHKPISLACGHTVCKVCLQKLKQKKCPVDQSIVTYNIDELPVNYALLYLAGVELGTKTEVDVDYINPNLRYHNSCCTCMEELAKILKPLFVGIGSGGGTTNGNTQVTTNSILSRPMQRKLITLFTCQLIEEEGRAKAARAARSIGERIVTELILHHQNPQQLSANLWAAVRGRGCQFLGPGMQEDVLRLILLALEDGSALSRKVLVLFVVQKLENRYTQASKTAIGHVVQLLYRASCFKVTKREELSSLMQLKEEYRSYESLRREHDAQIVHIATEAGLRISPEQWSSLLYGDATHKSHMQSIIDKLQTPQSFTQSINELTIVLQRSGDPFNLQRYHRNLDFLANIDPSSDAPAPSWENLEAFMKSVKTVVICLIDFIKKNECKRTELNVNLSARYKTSMCRDLTVKGVCQRYINCTFAHSQEEMEKYRAKNKKIGMKGSMSPVSSSSSSSSLTATEKEELDQLSKMTSEKLLLNSLSMDTACIASTPAVNTCTSTATKTLLDTDSPCIQPSHEREVSPDMSHLSATAASFIPKVETQNLPQAQCRVAAVSPHVHQPSPEQSGPTHSPTQYVQSQTPPQCSHSPQFAQTIQPHPPVPNIHQHTGQPLPPMINYNGTCSQYRHNWPGMVQNPVMHRFPNDGNTMHQGHNHGASYVMYNPPSMQIGQCEHCFRTSRIYHCPSDSLPCHGLQQTIPPQMPYLPHTPSGPQPPVLNGSVSTKTIPELQKRKHEIIDHLHKNQQRKILNSYRQSHKVPTSTAVLDPNYSATDGIHNDLNRSLNDSYMVTRTTSSLNIPCTISDTLTKWCKDDLGSCLTYSLSSRSLSTDGDSLDSMVCTQNGASQSSSSRASVVRNEVGQNIKDDDGIFIPFDPPLVSKYGPISRMAKSKMKSTDPVQVTADEMVKTMTHITAITPVNSRPYPSTSRAPSRFNLENDSRILEDPQNGQGIQAVGSRNVRPQPHTLWDMYGVNSSVQTPGVSDGLGQEMKTSNDYADDHILANELQAIEMEISMKTSQKPKIAALSSNLSHFDPAVDVAGVQENIENESDRFSLSQEEKQQLQHLQLKEYQLSLEARRRVNDSLISQRQQEQHDKRYMENHSYTK